MHESPSPWDKETPETHRPPQVNAFADVDFVFGPHSRNTFLQAAVESLGSVNIHWT